MPPDTLMQRQINAQVAESRQKAKENRERIVNYKKQLIPKKIILNILFWGGLCAIIIFLILLWFNKLDSITFFKKYKPSATVISVLLWIIDWTAAAQLHYHINNIENKISILKASIY